MLLGDGDSRALVLISSDIAAIVAYCSGILFDSQDKSSGTCTPSQRLTVLSVTHNTGSYREATAKVNQLQDCRSIARVAIVTAASTASKMIISVEQPL